MSGTLDDFMDELFPQKKEGNQPLEGGHNAAEEEELVPSALVQYSTFSGGYLPTTSTISQLPSGVYRPVITPEGHTVFVPCRVVTDKLIEFPDSVSESVIAEISKFWTLSEKFKEFGFSQKRGYLLHGPHGSGKSSTLSHIMKRMINMGGLVMLAEHPNILSACLKRFREVEPTRPVVIIWEDIDSIIKRYGESEVLSVLDGESQISHVVFIATTNFPEDLEKRITNRPSRFDRVELIGMPSAAARRIYLETKLGNTLKEDGISLDKLVKDTDGLSIAHLRELIVNVWCLGNTVDATIARLRGMNKTPTSASYENDGKVGFGK
jgi:ATPase family associated with various cellular activities (AAA)